MFSVHSTLNSMKVINEINKIVNSIEINVVPVDSLPINDSMAKCPFCTHPVLSRPNSHINNSEELFNGRVYHKKCMEFLKANRNS